MSEWNDRAAGAMLGAAAGDVLAAARRCGPGGREGAWSTGTAMALPILQAAAAGDSLTQEATHDEILARWFLWSRDAPSIGEQTSAVLHGMREQSAHAARLAARALHERTGRTAGAGSLLRTVPVALPFVAASSATGLARAAARLSTLTHADQDAADACVLWSAAIRHAIRAAVFDVRVGLPLLGADRRERWLQRIEEAEERSPHDLPQSGWVVPAFQAAWSAIIRTPVPVDVPARHLRSALESALEAGDAVAVVAGGLLGARWGASAVPAEWRRRLHGRSGVDGGELTRLAVLAVNGGLPDGSGWPAVDRVRPSGHLVLAPHPHDDGVLLGSLAALDDLSADVDAVVSLCRTGRHQTDREQVEFWLIDAPDRNPNLDLVLRDAADTVAALRAEGKRVLLHCAEGRGRTPAVAALYAALHRRVPARQALVEVVAALPQGMPQRFLQDAVLRIAPPARRAPALASSPTAAPVPARTALLAPEPAPQRTDVPAPLAASVSRIREANAVPRPLLHVDLDTAMLDRPSGVARLPARVRDAPRDPETEAPGVVALMDPVDGAIEGFRALAAVYDAYLVSAAPWGTPSGWADRLAWVQLHFGTAAEGNPAYRRVIFSHSPDRPAVLITAREVVDPDRGLVDPDGEVVRFGSERYPGWAAVLAHLLPREAAPGEQRPTSAVERESEQVEMPVKPTGPGDGPSGSVPPGPVELEPTQPDPVQPEPVQPEAAQSEHVEPEAVQPDAVRPEQFQPDPVQAEPAQTGRVRVERVRGEVVPPRPLSPRQARNAPRRASDVRGVEFRDGAADRSA